MAIRAGLGSAVALPQEENMDTLFIKWNIIYKQVHKFNGIQKLYSLNRVFLHCFLYRAFFYIFAVDYIHISILEIPSGFLTVFLVQIGVIKQRSGLYLLIKFDIPIPANLIELNPCTLAKIPVPKFSRSVVMLGDSNSCNGYPYPFHNPCSSESEIHIHSIKNP